jgi:hypothetical protein
MVTVVLLLTDISALPICSGCCRSESLGKVIVLLMVGCSGTSQSSMPATATKWYVPAPRLSTGVSDSDFKVELDCSLPLEMLNAYRYMGYDIFTFDAERVSIRTSLSVVWVLKSSNEIFWHAVSRATPVNINNSFFINSNYYFDGLYLSII